MCTSLFSPEYDLQIAYDKYTNHALHLIPDTPSSVWYEARPELSLNFFTEMRLIVNFGIWN